MTDPTPPPPLWRSMLSEFVREFRSDKSCAVGYAAELRAVAEAVAPDMPEPNGAAFGRQNSWFFAMGRWEAQQDIRRKLLDEARRAEVEE